MSIRLYKHQQKVVTQKPSQHLLAWECGTGKSLTAIKLTEGRTALIICPKSIKEQWEEQVDDSYIVVTKEIFRRDWNKISRCQALIVDEAHYFSGMKSQMHKNLIKYINKHNITRIYLLTATPYMSTPWNIFALGKILRRDWNYMAFKYKFFNEMRMGRRTIPVIKKNIEKEIAKIVNNLGSTVKMEDCFDIPEQTFQTEYFDLTPEQKKAMKEVDDVLPIVRFTKYHQICGGTLKYEFREDEYYKSEKLNRLIDLAKEHKKLVVVCRYNNEIDHLKKVLNGYYLIVINGQVKNRHELIKMAEERDDCIVIINAACSEGYELPSFPIMIFYSYDFSLKNYIQMKGRILRANKLKKNVYISLIVKNSIDEDVKKCIDKKVDFDVEIYSKENNI